MSIFRHGGPATAVHSLPGGWEIAPHWHDDHQIVYAGKGVLVVRTNDGSWVAPATRAIWIPARTVHRHRAHGATDLHTIGLPVTANPLGLTRPAVLRVSPLLRELLLECSRYGETETPQVRRLRAVLLDQLRSSPEQPVHLPAAHDPRLAAVCALLARDPGDGRTLAALGAATGIGERTLSRLFRAEFGMTFPQWRTQLRLRRALLLLADDLPVTVVAHRCGWASTSAFIDVFRAAFGHTPGTHSEGGRLR